MAESIHDWAVKLGMVRDEASFSAAEKLSDTFTNAIIRNNERMKQSSEAKAAAEKQALLNREGEKIRKSTLSPEDTLTENKVRLGELYISGAIGVDTFTSAVRNLNIEYAKFVDMQEQPIRKANIDAANKQFDAETQRLLQQKEKYEAAREYGYNSQTRQDKIAADLEEKRVKTAAANKIKAAEDVAREQAKIQKANDAAASTAFDVETRRLLEQKKKYEAARAYGYNSQVRQDKAREAAETIRLASGQERQAQAAALAAREQAQLNALLQQYGNHAERVQADINQLDAALERGTITTRQHGIAVAEATRRMNSMRGGAGNMGYAIGELARGAEDFITVMSITGFKAESVGMAMRGAGNNISQATNLIAGPLTGALVGMGAILGAQIIPKLWGASAATDKWTNSMERFLRINTAVLKQEQERLDLQSRLEKISNETDPFSNISNIKVDKAELAQLGIDSKMEDEKLRAQTQELSKLLLPDKLRNQYKNVLFALGDEMGIHYETVLADITQTTADIYREKGPEEALKYYIVQMKMMNTSLNDTLQAAARSGFYTGDKQGLLGDAVAFTGNGIWDAEAVNNAESITENADEMLKYIKDYNTVADKIHEIEIAREHANAAIALQLATQTLLVSNYSGKIIEDLEKQIDLAGVWDATEEKRLLNNQRLNQLMEDYKQLGEAGVALANEQFIKEEELAALKAEKLQAAERESERDKLDIELETLQLKAEELLMVSKLTDLEKESYNLMKRRAEILSTGAGSPAELEAVFQNEMRAKANDLNNQYLQSAPALSVSTASRVQALGDANKAVMEGMGNTKDKELVRAMKAVEDAIRNPNRNRGVMFVEVR